MRPIEVVSPDDEVTLRGWVVPGTGPDTIVVCHGVGRSKSEVVGHIQMLHQAGYHAVAVDMRNHGDSDRTRSYRNAARRYTRDLRAVLAAVHQDPEIGGRPLGILAFSFSTWPALLVLREQDRPPVVGIVADSGPTAVMSASLASMGRMRLDSLPEALQRPWCRRLYHRVFVTSGMYMLGSPPWLPDLSGASVRLMFVAGGRDPLIPADQIAATARHYDAELWTSDLALHSNAIRFDRAEYEKRVLGFLTAAFADAVGQSDRAVHG